MRDICIQCGTEQEEQEGRIVWPKPCHCGGVIVHRQKCDTCTNVIGFIIDDDYHSPEILRCSACLMLVTGAAGGGGYTSTDPVKSPCAFKNV